MTIQTASPLPECELCEIPTARTVWEANGRLCTRCSTGIAATVRMLPVRDPEELAVRRQLRADRFRALDETVITEGWKPPVPGARA